MTQKWAELRKLSQSQPCVGAGAETLAGSGVGSRETRSVPGPPVPTGRWLPACWCLIVCSCWFCHLTLKRHRSLFHEILKLCHVFCWPLGLSQAAAHVFPQFPHAWLCRGRMVCKWCTAVQPSPCLGGGENRVCLGTGNSWVLCQSLWSWDVGRSAC